MSYVQIYNNPAFDRRQLSESKPQICLFLAFYNKIENLKLVFASLEVQSLKDFEVIVCDDGSKPEIVEQVKELAKASNFPVKHIWHPDRGFHKNEALNRGVLASTSEYLAFVDADCILHPEFLKDHVANREKGRVLAGRRADLTPWVVRKVTIKSIREGFLQKNWWWIMPAIAWMKDNNGIKGVRISPDKLWHIANRKERGIVGCNFSMFKEDLLKANGFDMSYTAPSIGEDSDLEVRLQMLGVTTKPLCFRAIQYHLYHRLLPRSEVNLAKFLKVRAEGPAVTPFGITQLGTVDAEL